jgi:hypothetical protein
MKLKEMNLWIKRNRHLRLKIFIAMINLKLRGHYQYYGITDNFNCMANYLYETQKMIFKWLNRRSQRKSYTWDGFNELLKIFPLARPRIHVNIYGN